MRDGIRRALGLGGPRTGKGRRTERRLAPGTRAEKLKAIVLHPAFFPALLVAAVLVAVTSATVWLSRQSLVIAPGRVMDDTRTVRAEFRVLDTEATEREREDRRARAPRVYNADEAAFDALAQSLRTLPTVLASAPTLAEVAPEIRAAFGLTEEEFAAIRAETAEGQATELWQTRVSRLVRRLEREPLLAGEEYQRVLQSSTDRIELRRGGSLDNVLKDSAISIEGELFADKIRGVVESAGFTGPRLESLVRRLTSAPSALYTFDRDASEKRREEAAASAPEVRATYRPGDVIYERGRVLTEAAYALAEREDMEHARQTPAAAVALRHAGTIGLMSMMTLALFGYLRLYYPRVLHSPSRLAGLALMLSVVSAVSCWLGVTWPATLWLSTVAPVVLASMVLIVAYDPRLAVVFAAAGSVVVGIALDLPVGYFAVIVTSIAVAGWRLREIRSRNDVIAAGMLTSVGGAGSALIVGLLDRPLGGAAHDRVVIEIVQDALRAGAGAFAAGALTLVLLPMVERVFDVVTGMTLSEWRDPRRTLLRELQQRAPGTFNHSHTVATLAESAAEAIGADGLHLYVGALYHDIGKMLKPEYFVENQGGGYNKHSKLSPAMSLLVIVGHVKDGLELAREHGLPRSLHHYIESHHGTTLVQYFFEAARRMAESGRAEDEPEEIEYRYPGPRPRTREAAILMVADAVESATRALAEPTPARIASLVHSLASKRLMDGQFDECGLTLRELAQIEDAIAKGLCAIYHGRIAYPSEQQDLNDTVQTEAKRTAERMG